MLPPARSREQPHVAHDQHGFLGPGAASAGNSNRAGHPADHLSEKRYRMIRNCCMVVLAQLTVPQARPRPARGCSAESPRSALLLFQPKCSRTRVVVMAPHARRKCKIFSPKRPGRRVAPE